MRCRKQRSKVRRRSRQKQHIHTPVRVGSAAMPAPFALWNHKKAQLEGQFGCHMIESHGARPAQNPRCVQLFPNASSHLWSDSCRGWWLVAMKYQPSLLLAGTPNYPPRDAKIRAHIGLRAHRASIGRGCRIARPGTDRCFVSRCAGCRCLACRSCHQRCRDRAGSLATLYRSHRPGDRDRGGGTFRTAGNRDRSRKCLLLRRKVPRSPHC